MRNQHQRHGRSPEGGAKGAEDKRVEWEIISLATNRVQTSCVYGVGGVAEGLVRGV